MSQQTRSQVNPLPKTSFTPVQSNLLQRKCGCGQSASLTGQCSECQRKKLAPERGSTDSANESEAPPVVHEVLRAPSKKIQPKLKVSQPNDKYEQEADRIANQIMQMPESPVTANGSIGRVVSPPIQRLENADEERARPEEELPWKPPAIAESIQRQEVAEEEGEELIQTKRSSSQVPNVTPDIEAGIQNLRQSAGQSLPQSIRGFMEPRFGQDFSGVRLHTINQAHQIAHRLKARAFTIGNDIVFGAGEFQPTNLSGRYLLAHELTHVLQQNKEPHTIRKAAINAPASPTERCVGKKAKTLKKAIADAKKRMKAAQDPIAELRAGKITTLQEAFEDLFAPFDSSDSKLLDNVKSNVNKIGTKLSSLTAESDMVKCLLKEDETCGDSTLAFVDPDDGIINFCDLFFQSSKEEQVLTVLHEVAHTVLSDGPDIYTHKRLFPLLKGFVKQPGVNNPDSLALFISVAAQGISLEKELAKVKDQPPKDQFNGFSTNEEQFVKKTLAFADSTVFAAEEDVRLALRQVNQVGNKFSDEAKETLARLRIANLLKSVEIREIFDDDDEKVKEIRKKLKKEKTGAGKDMLKVIADVLANINGAFQKNITVTRSSEERKPGITVGAGGSSIEVFNSFFFFTEFRGFQVYSAPSITGPILLPSFDMITAAPPVGKESPEQLKQAMKVLLSEFVKGIGVADISNQELKNLVFFLITFNDNKGIITPFYE